MTGQVEDWLAHLADPRGLNARVQPEPFADADAVARLVDLAAAHNVRPALCANLLGLLKRTPAAVLVDPSNHAVGKATAAAREARLVDTARAVLLARAADTIMARVAEAGLPAILVKGADFARNAYGGLQARTFSDVDLLCRPDAEAELGTILAELGYEAEAPKASRVAHTERKFLDRSSVAGTVLVEVHTDLVHAPELRAAQSLTYDLYAAPEHGGATPAARLVLAALHGATSHLFGRLQYVVDGMMVARMGVDATELAERADRSGARLATATMLRLADEIFDCAEAPPLMAELRPLPFGSLESRLITRHSVLGGKAANRFLLLPQRYLYRRLLRMHGQGGAR